MFLLDDLLLAPGKAVMFLFEELARKAQEDFLDDDSVKEQLQEIYALLDSGKISGNEFDSRESQLLARLEQIARAKFPDNWGAPADPTRQIEAYVPSAEDQAVNGQPFIDVIASRSVAVESGGGGQGVAAQPPAVEDRANQPLVPDVNVLAVLRRLLESSRPVPPPAEHDNREAHEATRDQENLERIMRWRQQKPAAEVAAPPPVASLPPSERDEKAHEATRDQENLERIMRWRQQQPAPQVVAPLPVAPLPVPPPVTPLPVTPLPVTPLPMTPLPVASLPVEPLPPALTYASATFERHAVPVMASLTMSQVIDCTVRGLSLLKLKVSTVSSVSREENGWRVTAELVERRSVPDTSDLLGVYELHLDEAGNILSYERTRIRRRSDLGRS